MNGSRKCDVYITFLYLDINIYFLLSLKKKETLPFVAPCLNLDGIMLCHQKRQIPQNITYMWNLGGKKRELIEQSRKVAARG